MNIDFEKMREPNFYNYTITARNDGTKKVNENGGWKNITICPICGSIEISGYKFEPNIPYAICSICDCLYATQIPANKFHAEYDSNNINQILNNPDEAKRKYRQERFMQERIGYIKMHLTKPLKCANLIDFGCNTGVFLEVARKYFNNITGIEQNKTMREYIRRKFDIKTNSSLFSVHNIYNPDVITLFDVIEHMDNPFYFIHTLKKELQSLGLLFIYTPNWRSLCFDILDSESTQYFPAEHFLFFSKKTVKFLAKKLDMQLIMYETRGMDWFDILSYDRDINNLKIKNSLLYNNINKLQQQTDKAENGNHMRFMLRKV